MVRLRLQYPTVPGMSLGGFGFPITRRLGRHRFFSYPYGKSFRFTNVPSVRVSPAW